MEYSNVADTCFTWTINNFINNDAVKKDCLRSSNFTSSIEPNRQWNLFLTINEKLGEHCDRCKAIKPKKYSLEPCNVKLEKKIIQLFMICNKISENPVDMKVALSIMRNNEKIYTRSFIVTTSGEETNFGFDNFIDFDELMIIINGNQLEIFVEIFFKTDEINVEFKEFMNSEFLSDVQIFIQEQKFYAHKVKYFDSTTRLS